MKAETIIANSEKRLPELIKQSYGAIDVEMARLIELAEKMPVAAFFREVEAVIQRIPEIYDRMDQRPIQNELETAMGEAIVGGLEIAL